MISSRLIPLEVWSIILSDCSLVEIISAYLSGVLPLETYKFFFRRKLDDLEYSYFEKQNDTIMELSLFLRQLIHDEYCSGIWPSLSNRNEHMFSVLPRGGIPFIERSVEDYGYSYLRLWPVKCNIKVPDIIRFRVFELVYTRRLMSVIIGCAPELKVPMIFLDACNPILDTENVSIEICHDPHFQDGRAFASRRFIETDEGHRIREMRCMGWRNFNGRAETS